MRRAGSSQWRSRPMRVRHRRGSRRYAPDAAMTASWPRFAAAPRGRRGGDAEPASASDTDRLGPLHELIREVKAYALARTKAPKDQPIDLRLDSMIPVVEGKMPMMVQANSTKQIQTAIAFAKQYRLKLILMGGADAMQCANLIKEAKVPVVVASVYRLPSRHDAVGGYADETRESNAQSRDEYGGE